MENTITVRQIDFAHRQDIKLPNQPFPLFGRMVPSYTEGRWSYTVERFPEETEMCFPDEDYDYAEMSRDCTFLGAYDGDSCVGLAILRRGFFRYLYLEDLKVDRALRGRGIGALLMEEAKKTALAQGWRGLYTIGQDNNLAACLFYLKTGFRIGGLDTEVYKGTSQEGKADILFYLDCLKGSAQGKKISRIRG